MTIAWEEKDTVGTDIKRLSMEDVSVPIIDMSRPLIHSIAGEAHRMFARAPKTHIRILEPLVQNLTPESVGIDGRWTPPFQGKSMSYAHIADSSAFSMGIFYLPAGFQIPFHDHPSMQVLCRILKGRVKLKALDWLDLDDNLSPMAQRLGLKSAVQTLDAELSAGDMTFLEHNVRNIHTIEALEDTAFLDILAPPYSAEEERDCQYYAMAGPMPDMAGHRPDIIWMRSIPCPATLVIKDTPYTGPKVNPTVLET
eukprot:Clim_evm23s51 gene=Clim_evmTU23s51